MFSKFLFVGLGGSGGKTLRFLKAELLAWAKQHDLGERLPQAWQFIEIDTPAVQDGIEINDLVDPLPSDEYLGLITQGVDFATVQRNLDIKRRLHDELNTWRVSPRAVNVPLVMGAGQFRAIGHTIAMAYAAPIHERLRIHLRRLQGPTVNSELAEFYEGATETRAREKPNLYTVVISSLAGGTGAGLLTLVCDILRAEQAPDDQVFAILYTPEVFSSLGRAESGGVYPNALGAISEVINGHWSDGDPHVDPSLQEVGVAKPSRLSGPRFPFLVGRAGADGVMLETADRVFAMMGRSLVSWVTDEKVQSRFLAHTIANWEQAAQTNVPGPVLVDEAGDDEGGLPLFSALGFARLSVGGKYFQDYVVRRLVKDAATHLATYHSHSEEAKRVARRLRTQDPRVISHEMASERLERFLTEAGLYVDPDSDADDPSANQIIHGLKPDADEAARNFDAYALQLAGVDDDTRQSAAKWTGAIEEAIDQASATFVGEYEDALRVSAAEWVKSTQASVIAAVETQIAHSGLSVARSVCELAAKRLASETRDTMLTNAASYREWTNRWQQESQQKLPASGQLTGDDRQVEEAVLEGTHYFRFDGDERLHTLASELCLDIAASLLRPLARTLAHADHSALNESRRVGPWPDWSDDALPPRDLHPPEGEFTLIRPQDYAGRFLSLLQATFEGDPPREQRDKIRKDVATGAFLRHDNSLDAHQRERLRCTRVEQGWWPKTTFKIDDTRIARRLDAEVRTSTKALEERAEQRLQFPGPFAKFLNLGMRSFLGSDSLFSEFDFLPGEIETNQKRFLAQLGAAIDASAPLVRTSAALMSLVHPDAAHEKHSLYLSQIPLHGHPLEPYVRERLRHAGLDDGTISDVLISDPKLDNISFTTSLHAPHSALVMESLLRPISEAWAEAQSSPARRKSFWRHRRARPIAKFAPAPESLLLCMTRGWFTGLLLGHISGDGPVRIAGSRGRPDAEFPHPLLTEPSNSRDWLPAILESLGLAYLEVERLSDLKPLNAYIELRELGRSRPGSDMRPYKQLNHALARWVDQGEPPESISEPHPVISGIGRTERGGAAGASERAKRLASELEGFALRYQEDLHSERSKWDFSPDNLSDSPLWTGMYPLIRQALAQLADACRKHATQRTAGRSSFEI